jgi:demethylmenaquinone methyltransferase/2-methoxy-6-polyprenyl-1,4-benzoquinol methylase
MTYIFMKVLESAPSRYDRGIRLLTWGGIDAAYDFLLEHVEAGQRVLDIGCGSGALTLAAARRGAQVTGIDINPQMLALARAKVEQAGLRAQVELREMGVAELDQEKAASFDVIMSSLCFSELTPDERNYALAQVWRLLTPKGIFLLADEVKPDTPGRRVLHSLIRLPLLILTYLLTQTTTHPLARAVDMVEAAGFEISAIRYNRLRDLVALVARKPQGGRA